MQGPCQLVCGVIVGAVAFPEVSTYLEAILEDILKSNYFLVKILIQFYFSFFYPLLPTIYSIKTKGN